MPNQSFADRINRINQGQSATHAATAPTPAPSSGRKAKLQQALHFLGQAGIHGNYAYAPVFRSLAKAGIIIKPMHYWSFVPLTLFSFCLFAFIFGGTTLLCLYLGVVPRPVAGLIRLGPMANLIIWAMLALGLSGLLKFQAKRARLPKWCDL